MTDIVTSKTEAHSGAIAPLEKLPLETYVPPAKPSLIGLSRAEIADRLGEIGIAPAQRKMRTQQLWHWMYVRGAKEFDEMTSISKEMRAQLVQHFTVARPEVVAEQISNDGTRKWLLRLPSGNDLEKAHEVECVYIPETDRGTLCVSSQVGCTLNCSFCHTGTQRLVRNLTAGEIVGQIMVARDRLDDWADRETPTGSRRVTNVVMMGMGEPLYNFDAVRDALLIVADNEGIGISRRRITLSTSGVVPNIARTGDEIGVMLAISLHAVRDELRNELVPLNRKYPIAELLQACRDYPGSSNARRITFEYVMLKDVNDSLDEAKLLVKLLKGIHAKINLIPFNPWPGTRYECSDWEQIEKFSEYIFNAGYSSPVRTPRGRDILAACGQLKSETEKLSVRERDALRAMAMTDYNSMALIGRLFVVFFAFLFACFAAGAIVVVAVLYPEFSDLATGPIDQSAFNVVLGFGFIFLSGFALLPALIVVLITEAFHIRGVLTYAVGGAIVGAACYLGLIPFDPQTMQFDGIVRRHFEIMTGAGIVAGLVYWMIAGRSAGNWREPPRPLRPPPPLPSQSRPLP